jgi:RNA polymerase sigma-70 factor (ECF subfamily)
MRDNEHTKSDTDSEFVIRCKSGDINAFEKIVKKYQKKMFNVSYRIIGDYNESDEVVQDAFVSAYNNIDKFRGKARFSTWLYSIVVNLSRNRLKQVKKRAYREELSIDDPVETETGTVKAEPASDDLSVLERMEKRELKQKVQSCIQSLEDEFREVIVLRDIQGFSYEDIGEMLKIAKGTVKSRLHRARESVKNCLKKTIGDV